MKKVIFLVIATIFLNGCFQVLALVGPAATGVASGNIYQSAISYSFSYGIKKTTGKTVIENVIDLNNKSKGKKKMVRNDKNEELIHSFYPRTYPETFKSIELAL
jgi:outer membrane lipoprotein-sorting protein